MKIRPSEGPTSRTITSCDLHVLVGLLKFKDPYPILMKTE
jgi:hypothetical protein